MANTLMFEVGIKRANEEYNKILEEVKALAKMADNSISLKVQLEKSNDLKTFLDALKQLGDGKMLEPLLHKIDNLQASMVRLGMIPKDIDYSNLEKQLQKVTVAYENYQKAREKAGLKEGQADVTGPTMALGQVYRTARANLEKEFGLSENVARATMDTFKNMGNTIQENMARIGGSKAGMESLSGEVGGLTTKVDALVNAFSSLVSQLKSLGTGSGVKDMATDVAKVDEGTTKMAQALAKAFGNLNEKKADVKVSEDSLATATNTAAAALKAEEAQAQATAASILRVADSISVATLATKNLYTILGGNREDIAKFLELANTMDMLSRKSAYIMNSGESFSGGKMGAFTEVKKEMEAVQAQMDELKKSGLSGSPIIDSFATAFKNLSEVLTAAGTSVKESAKNLKSLGEGAKNLEKISESQERANRATNQATATEDKAASSANANAEAIQKLLTATQELTTATNNLKMAIGSWGQDKGTIATMVAQFEELRKKITQVVEQWEKLAMVKVTGVQNVQVPSFNIDLSSIEPTIKTLNEAVAQLKKSMDLLWESTNRMESSLKSIVTPETFKKVESDAASAKQKVDELSKSVEGMKMQSEKKGSETTLNANLDVLKNHTKNVYEALTQIAVEYEKLSNQKLRDDGLEQRLLKLREYYEWLQKVATMTDTLSKPGALKADATKFNGELLMGKQTKEMWSDKAVKDFQKIVEEILSGRRAAESFETAIQKLKERVEEFNSTGSKGFGGVGAAMETINRVGELNIQTLIKEQGHIERMMKLAEGSSKYMEGHKVAGMDKLQAVQDSNMNYLQTLNRWISLILQNRDNPDIIRFLNTPQSLKLPLPGRADDVAMFNAHYDKLKHSISDTSAAARQLVKDMSLTDANASIKQWNTTCLETGLYNVQDAIQGIMRAWRNASQYADEDMTKAVAQQINRLNAIKQEILTAMTNEQLLSTRHGYASVINPDSTHTIKESKDMARDLTAFRKEREKAEKDYNREVDRFTEQSKKAYEKAEKEKAAAAKQTQREQEAARKAQERADNQAIKDLQTRETSQRRFNGLLRDMGNLLSNLESRKSTGSLLNVDTTRSEQAILRLKQFIDQTLSMDVRNFGDKHYISEYAATWSALKKELVEVANAQKKANDSQDRLNKSYDKARLKAEADAAKQAANDNERWAKSMNTAAIKANELATKIRELEAVEKRGLAANVDTTALTNTLNQLRNNLAILQSMEAGMRLHGTAGDFVSSAQYRNPLLDAGKQAADVKERAAQANNILIDSERRLSQAINASTSDMSKQSQVLSDLKMMATQYLSVWGAQSFLQSIIQTGGLLEQQRLSIGAILQNAGQATELFGQIKALAVRSPFGVVELDKMSKQLTAYGFEYKELFDWTKRLADISAATGTSVDRLALALGHVRSEGALSGYTLRQFAMANVPVLRMLSENLGISTKEVREKVRKKDISYDDVKDILKQLTDEGGMFYNAQEIMSQALNAKFKNLHDAFDIMYGEIAESGVGDALKRLAEILTAGAKEWGRYGKDILGVVAAIGMGKAAIYAYNVALGSNTAATLKQAAADKKRQVDMLRLAKEYRALTAAEWQLLATHSHFYATSGKLTVAQLALLLNEKKLSQEELFRAVALGKINKQLALKAALELKATTAVERHAKAELLWGLRGVQTISKWRLGWLQLGNAIRTAGSAIFGFAKMALPLVALSLIMDRFSRVSEMKDKATEAEGDLIEKATSDLKVLDETFKEYAKEGYVKEVEIKTKWINGKNVRENGLEFNDELLSKKDLTSDIENLKGTLEAMSPMYEGDLVDIDKMNDQVEQFKALIRKLESIRHSKDYTEANAGIVTDTDVKIAGSNWFTRLFGDSFTEDIKDYEGRANDVASEINALNEETIDKIDKGLQGKLTEMQEKYSLDSRNSALRMLFIQGAQKQVLEGDTAVEQFTKGWHKIQTGIDDSQKLNLYKLFNSVTTGGMSRSLQNQFGQLASDTQEMAKKLSAIVENEFSNDSDGAIYAVTTYIKKLLAMSGITDPQAMEQITQLMLETMRQYLPQTLQTSVIDEMQKRIVMEQFMKLLGNSITETTTPEEAEKALQKYSKMVIAWGKQMNINLAKIGMDNAEAYRDGLDAKINAVKLKTDWQKRASQVFVENIAIKTNFDKSLDEFAQAVQKDLKEKQAYLKRNQAHLKMTLNIDTDVLMNADKLRALMDKLAIEGQKKAMNGDWDGAQAIYSRIDKEIKPYYDALMAVQEDKSWLKKEGYPETDPTKGNKGKQEDKEAKRLREIAKLYKDAYDWYNKYEKQVGEAGALKKVQAQFQPLFDEFNKTWKTNLTLDSIPTYKKNLTELLNEAMKLYKTPKHKNSYMVEAIKQFRDAISNVDYEEANRQMDIFASKVKIQLDSLTRAWSTFNSVRETTGNADFAAQIARVSYDGNLIQNSADAIRNQIQSYYNEAGGNGVLIFDMELSDEDILKKFQNAVPSNDEGVENYQKRIKGLVEAYKQWRDLQRTVRDDAITAYAKMVTDSMSLKDKIAKINNEYQKTITNLNTLRDQGIIGQPEYAKRKQQAQNQRKVDNLSALANSATFEQSFGIVGNVLKNAARELDKKLREEISSEDFKNLTPSQQKSYIEASDKLHSASQTATSPFNLNAWGELMEASRTYKDNVNKLVASLLRLQKATIALEQAEEDERNAKNESQRKDAQERRKKAEEEKRAAEQAVENDQTEVNQSGQKLKEKSDDAVEGLDNFSTILGQFTQGTLSSFVLAVGNLIKSIKGDGEMAQSVGQLFGKAGEKIGGLVGAILSIIDALGDDPTGFIDNLLNKIASVIENVLTNLPQIIGSVIKGAGNIVASVVDGVGGLFGLDFGLSDLFNPDKKLQERIDDLKADVTKIEANTSVLRSLRERSLGYDSGQMRKDIANVYNKYNRDLLLFGKYKIDEINVKYGAAGRAMSEFYSQNLNGNGYSQEYANLLKQRQDYIDMYNAENDKKDSSASAMAEYQSKIAELDEEIMFFTQDLANTLWGIDIKSWANQISDALWNAFENGENAVKAFEKTAKDIVASVAKEMMKLGFIEPLMQTLQKQLFGTWNDSLEMYEGGAIKYTKDKNGNIGIDMQGSEKAVLKVLGSFYGQSEEFAKAGETFYNWVERATGIRFSDNDSALSGNIKGITEDTADLLASYINAIRADVAMNRAFIAMFIQEYWVSYIEQITSVHTTLRNIDRNVAAMALTFSETGKIYGLIENISSRLDKFANGVDKISVQ